MSWNLFLRRVSTRSLCSIVVGTTMICASPIARAVPVDSLRVMSYNILNGGFGGFQPVARTVDVIVAAGADVIGMQESSASADDIALALGSFYNTDFYYANFFGGLSVVSRYPITEVLAGTGQRGRGVKLELSPGQEAYFFNAHLEPFPYEPYSIRDGTILTEAGAIASAQSSRGASTATLLSNMSTALGSGLPMFLVGDFNEPSHLDWTQEAADAGLNFEMKVDWPASNAVVNAGFTDAFREVRPDEVNDQARTWTPGTPAPMGAPPTVDPDEVHDRIDFVYDNSEHVVPVEALTLGYDATDGFTDIQVRPYPSDHRAVVVEFEFNYPVGDVNFDGAVDGRDFLAWQRGDSPNPLSADDLADWQTAYDAGPLVTVNVIVPEPATIWLLTVVAVPFLCRP